MPILYIHAGAPKTGTTALQSFLCNNRKLLAEHSRIYYPTTGINPHRGAHQNLFPVVKETWLRLYREISAFPECDIVLSEEIIFGKAFSSFDQSHLAMVREILPGYEVKIILYLRRLDDHMKSVFSELTKRGLLSSMPSYAQFIANKNISLTTSAKLDAAALLISRDNLLFRLYDKTLMKNGDIIADFFDLLGRKKPEDAISPSYTNPSIPPQALPFIVSNIFTLPSDDPLRREIIELLRKAYTFPQGSGVGDDYLGELEEEITKIDAYMPGYKNLFTGRKLSFSFPEADVKDPQLLFVTALLYKLLIAQRDAAPIKSALNKTILNFKRLRLAAPLRAILRWWRAKRG